MNQAQIETQLVAILVALACALPGVFLVLRRSALLSDAISHTVLLGIVIGFSLIGDIHSPLLIGFAALAGVITVSLSELLLRTGRVREDAAIGLVFPALFSIAVIIITRNFGDVHLDTDAVLLGELAFAPFNRTLIGTTSLPTGVITMGAIGLINLVLLLVFYKELKLATFDAALAASLGFAPAVIHYGLMTVVSVTAVGAFDHVGSILVIALMIAPPAAASLLTRRLRLMLLLSAIIGSASAVAGYWAARALDVNISGAMAASTGVFFLVALLFAPEQGLIRRALERGQRRQRFAVEMLLVHLRRHEGTQAAASENTLPHLSDELKWQTDFATATVRRAAGSGWVNLHGDTLLLTEQGRHIAQRVLAR